MNTKTLLTELQKVYPQAIGFILLNEGQGVEIYSTGGVVLHILPVSSFMLMFQNDVINEGVKC